MTVPRLGQALGLCRVVALGIVLMVACSPPPPGGAAPAAPTLLTLEIPNDALANAFATVLPTFPATTMPTPTPAKYVVLPLLPTTAPIVRAVLRTPTNSSLTVTASDAGAAAVTLPLVPASSPGPATGYYQVLNSTSDWHIVIRYPDTFEPSKAIRTMVTDTVGGVASAPLTFDMSFRGSTLMVAIATNNNDGRVTSNPPGIDCPGACSIDFLAATSVQLTQSVLHNQTEFMAWTDGCVGTGNSCTVSLFVNAPGKPTMPLNPTVTAHFRQHVNAAIPPDLSCASPAPVAGKQWVAQPNCGGVSFATLQCDGMGYFCCGASTGVPSPRCSGQNLTTATCRTDNLGVFGGYELIQPGGCYVVP